MGGANDGKTTFNWMENLSLQTNRNLQRFLSIDSIDTHELAYNTSNQDEEEIELSLGLSLGGRFGIDKNDKKLARSSSIASTFPITRDDDDVAVNLAPPRRHTLGRTSSLPVETEEEWRKRKEIQTLRRMAAKRRRSEKQRVSGIPTWGPPKQSVVSMVEQFKSVEFKGVESQGGSSSGGSESAQGSSSFGEASPASVQSRQDQSNNEVAGSSGTKGKENIVSDERENPTKRPVNVERRGKETGLNSLEDMPCVFTQGDGPNGRRIEGILYRYGKGEEVSIMCVCHGKFLSPMQFVEHAGVTDVEHPLKHIVVNPASNSFL